ncbi:2895_t:CDS:2, partial [Entrophospora sp. SA101]
NFVGSQKWPHVKSLVLVANTIKAVFPYVSAMRESMLEQFTNCPVNLDKFSNIKGVITSQQNPLDDLQHLSAFEHCNVMRNLFPLEVWINY